MPIDRRSLILAGSSTPLLMAAKVPAAPLTGAEIVARAHAAGGGETWLHPKTLIMTGHAAFYPKASQESQIKVADYRMWRVYPARSTDAHVANGMVRIDAKLADGKVYFQNAYDGADTFTQAGLVPGAQASKEWSENFGFGIIRFALNPGFSIDRLPDDTADGRPIFMLRVNDPDGGKTLFGISRDTYQVVWLGFATTRGWHERRYSNFYRKPGVSFTQPGLVRLYYDGIKQNEIAWTDYRVGEPVPRTWFQLTAASKPAG